MSFVLFVVEEPLSHRATEATEVSRQDYRIHKIVPTSPLFVVFYVFRGKKGLEAGGGTAASPSTQGREAAAPPAHANLGAMVLATKNTKSAFFSAFSAISAVKNNASEMFVFNRKERKERKEKLGDRPQNSLRGYIIFRQCTPINANDFCLKLEIGPLGEAASG